MNFAPSAFPRSRDLPDFVPCGCCNLWGAREGPFTPTHTPGLGRVWDRDTQDIIWDSSRYHVCTLAPRHRHCNSSPRVGAAQATIKTPPGCLGSQLLDPVGFPCDGLRRSPPSPEEHPPRLAAQAAVRAASLPSLVACWDKPPALDSLGADTVSGFQQPGRVRKI